MAQYLHESNEKSLLEAKVAHKGDPMVGVVTVNEHQPLQEAKTRKAKVGRTRRLQSLTTRYTDAYVRLRHPE